MSHQEGRAMLGNDHLQQALFEHFPSRLAGSGNFGIWLAVDGHCHIRCLTPTLPEGVYPMPTLSDPIPTLYVPFRQFFQIPENT